MPSARCRNRQRTKVRRDFLPIQYRNAFDRKASLDEKVRILIGPKFVERDGAPIRCVPAPHRAPPD